uniref:Uncharacterized protein n=1 Tax=Oryza glumipatula TaxID=40148 RepID=A0A0E0ALR2_9ORYZ
MRFLALGRGSSVGATPSSSPLSSVHSHRIWLSGWQLWANRGDHAGVPQEMATCCLVPLLAMAILALYWVWDSSVYD